MTDQGGGALWKDLGPLGDHSSVHSGVVGESLGVATRRMRFTLVAPSSVFISRLPSSDATAALALQGPRRRRIVLDETGRARGVDVANTTGDESTARLPPGAYEVVIATRQWQSAAFLFSLRIFPLGLPRGSLAGGGGLRLRLSTIRPEVFATGRGGLVASLQPAAPLVTHLAGTGRLRMGLQIIPSYQQPALAGLGHAWFIRRGGTEPLLRVGAPSGLDWETLLLPEGTERYLPTRLTVDDYRANPGQRVIFSDRTVDLYRTYPDIGVNPTFLASQASPDLPGVPFLGLTNGRHQREFLLGLPIENERMALVHFSELLLWNNDIIRELDTALPLVPRLEARITYRAFFHRRRVNVFVIDGRGVRRLPNPPGGLLQRLDALMPPLDGQLVERGLRVPGPAQSLPTVRPLVPLFALEGRLPARADRVFGADPSDRSSGLLLSFGMTRLLAADPEMSSAAAYGTLTNFEAISQRSDYDPRGTGFVLSTLTNRPDGTPILSPWLRDGGYRLTGDALDAYADSMPQLLRYARWDGPLPADAADSVSPSDARWTLAAQGLQLNDLRLFRAEEPRLYLCYDWGQAPYCREQLQLLGFSGEDLSSAPPTQPRQFSLNAGNPRPLQGRGALALGELKAIKIHILRVTHRGQGVLSESNLSWCLRIRIRSRGALRMQLTVTPDLTIVRRLLAIRLAGRGRLDRSSLFPTASRLTGRGGLGRFKLQARPPNEFPNGAVTGRGRLFATLSAT
jgi:hypothetical protein